MAWRDAVGDTSTHDLVGQLAVTPMADWATRAARLLTRQGNDLADLLWAEAWLVAGSRRVGQSLRDPHLGQRQRTQSDPASPPQADRLHVHRHLLGNRGVAVPHGC